ncbi:MAG: diacylglycerol kinase family protein [Bacteroidia bacterium]
MSYLRNRGSSFGYAFAGVISALREPNFRIQFIAAILVIILGCVFHINRYEWLAVIGCCTIVLSLELINSAVENLCNMVTTEIHPSIKFIKDVCAAAVLIASLAALAIGCIVFYPYISRYFS